MLFEPGADIAGRLLKRIAFLDRAFELGPEFGEFVGGFLLLFQRRIAGLRDLVELFAELGELRPGLVGFGGHSGFAFVNALDGAEPDRR